MSCISQRHAARGQASAAVITAFASLALAVGVGCSTAQDTDGEALVTAADEAPIRLDIEVAPTVDPAMATDAAEFVWPEDGGNPVRVAGISTITDRDVVSSRFSRTNEGRAMLVLSLTDEAGDRMLAATSTSSEQRAVVRWDGDVVYVPVILGPLRTVAIVGDRSELETIATWLKERSAAS